jgi:hypothetical protein
MADEPAEEPRAPIGTQLGVLAAAFHWVSALLLVAGFLTSEPGHTEDWKARYPEWEDRQAVMTNFSHADCAPMMLDQMTGMREMQSWLVFEGIFESIACLLAICTILCVKAHMNYKTQADEKELIMFSCMILGLTIPLLEFSLRAGPVSFVSWVGSEAAKSDGGMWTGFTPTHIQTLMMTLQVVEALFDYLNVFADLLLGIGFVLMSTLGSRRAAVIIDNRTRLVGAWTGGLLLLAFLFGLLQVSSGRVHRLGAGAMAGLNTVIALFLIPTYFVLLGIGLGRVSTIQTLNEDLDDAVAEVGESTADDYMGEDGEVMAEVAAADSQQNPMIMSGDE